MGRTPISQRWRRRGGPGVAPRLDHIAWCCWWVFAALASALGQPWGTGLLRAIWYRSGPAPWAQHHAHHFCCRWWLVAAGQLLHHPRSSSWPYPRPLFIRVCPRCDTDTQSLWLVCQERWLQEMLGLGRAEGSVTFLFHYSMLLSRVPASSCDGIQLFLSLRSKPYVCLREWWDEVK